MREICLISPEFRQAAMTKFKTYSATGTKEFFNSIINSYDSVIPNLSPTSTEAVGLVKVEAVDGLPLINPAKTDYNMQVCKVAYWNKVYTMKVDSTSSSSTTSLIVTSS